MTEWSQVFSGLETWIRDYGAGAVFLLLTCESLGLPLPGESLLDYRSNSGRARRYFVHVPILFCIGRGSRLETL